MCISKLGVTLDELIGFKPEDVISTIYLPCLRLQKPLNLRIVNLDQNIVSAQQLHSF